MMGGRPGRFLRGLLGRLDDSPGETTHGIDRPESGARSERQEIRRRAGATRVTANRRHRSLIAVLSGCLNHATLPNLPHCGSVTASREPLADAPFVFAQEYRAQRAEAVGTILERSQDRLAVEDRESNDARLTVVCFVESLSGVVEAFVPKSLDQLEHEAIGNGETGEHHRGDHTFVLGRT